MTITITDAINRALAGQNLLRSEMASVIGAIMDGETTPAQIGGLLIALRAKGESVDEIVGAATAMRDRARSLDVPGVATIDTCGTGGDGAGTVNISTLAAILIAACGGHVAKHGNRALSSKCGSADVLEELGVAIDIETEVIQRCFSNANICFAFAPSFHAATKHAAGPRRELGTRTIFNLLGPLTNPAHVSHQVVGVFDKKWCEPVASALGALGLRRAAIVHGEGGIDELAIRGETLVAIWNNEHVSTRTLSPKHFGVDELDPVGLAGGDAAFNANVMRKVLAGVQVGHGERYEPVLRAAAMTAALGLELLEEGPIELDRLPAQLARAAATATSGAARLVLHKWVELSRSRPEDDDVTLYTMLKPDDYKGVE